LQKFYVLTKYYGVMRIMYSFVAANTVRQLICVQTQIKQNQFFW
jgi:hypothetical protein